MIVSTKLHIPRVRNSLVSRPRLMRMLHEGMDAKLTLVSAQAGYGKTTALSEWAKQCGSPVAWVSLDKQDNDWIRLWSYVLVSVQEQVPGFGETVRSMIGIGPTETLEPAIAALLNELNLVNSELVIIFDDYHVIELPAIHRSMMYLLEHLPPRIHLYIASRTELPIPTARLLAKGEMHKININDLRFQLDEGLAFFRDMTDLVLTQEQVAELFHQTEGWISGLQLAALSLKRSDNISETIQQFSGQQHHISDYLLEEVFRHQSEPVQAFLLQTSILNRMNHSLCEAVTGQMNGQEQLERLEQRNLFVTPLDDHKNWYRYHHLLSDFLQQLLFRTEPDKWIEVHTLAANWLEEHGLDEEAVDHYLEGKQASDAVRLIEKNLHTLVQSKSVVLIRWVSALPEDSFAEKPMIELFYISVLLGVGEWEAAFRRVEQAKVRFQALQGKMSDVEWNQVMGNIYFFCSVTSYLQKDLEQTSAYFELVEQYVPGGSLFQTMGRNRYQGYELFDDHLAHINDLHAADAYLSKWIAIWGSKKEYPFLGYLSASYSKLLYEWNRLDEAEHVVSQVLGRKDMEPFARILIHMAISASRIQQAKGNSQHASELLTQLKHRIDSPDYELFMLKIEAEQACLSVQQGFLQEALDWLQRCGLTHTDEVSRNRMAEHLSAARVLVACERMDEGLYLLERMQALLVKEDALRDRIKVSILQSVVLQRLGQPEASFIHLETALRLAEPQGYIRSFIDEGPIMAEMLSAFLKKVEQGSLTRNNSQVSLTYVKQLLLAMDTKPDENRSPKGILTEQEKRILRLVAGGLSNKEIAQRLYITGETVKFHMKNVYRKLGVNNRIQALQHAKEWMI
ncbi:LuxR C-terminal-related transcriptional regulator [Paenibacillus dokdonensis]|uniref:LuxR C-terminal-related transcriptional regulator n=1 Tax=Paenibacillus dokdonensis TaxID=2567944 RepID=A0ABU6GGS3_9BACL|nr:LuxR C-terminal-related transcriptional regulator [Paenibacillus dokdonensis]MEC0238317.1 LuxR C-terminal-related transcriptional regulator [Paenibacillus dokdonensis]